MVCEDPAQLPGVYYPIGLGPMGIETARFSRYNGNSGPGLFHQQKSNGLIASSTWPSTVQHYDVAYGMTVYPSLSRWQTSGRTISSGKGGVAIRHSQGFLWRMVWRQSHPINCLGFVRCTFTLALDMSQALGVDDQRRAKWQHILII